MRHLLTLAGISLLMGSAVLAGPASPAVAEEAVACSAQIANGGFETPVMSNLVEADIFFDPTDDFVTGGWYVWPGVGSSWSVVASLPATDTATSQSLAWHATEGGVELQDNVTPFAGDQYAEITGLEVTNTLYQTIATVPGQIMGWSLAHQSAGGEDIMEVQIGPDLASLISQNATPDTGVGVTGQPTYIADEEEWRVWRGTYVVPDGQFETVFGFNGISTGSGDDTVGNHIDEIAFACDPNSVQPGAAIPAEPSLASTGLSTAALLAGTVFSIGLFAMAFSSFGARARLRELAVDARLASALRNLDARLRRLERRRKR